MFIWTKVVKIAGDFRWLAWRLQYGSMMVLLKCGHASEGATERGVNVRVAFRCMKKQ
jgi:hypothetical protein